MWNLKNNTNECICKTETDSDIENKLVVTKGEREGGEQIRGMGLRDTNYQYYYKTDKQKGYII